MILAKLLKSLDNVLDGISDAERAMFIFMVKENEESGNPELSAELLGISKRLLNAEKIINEIISELKYYAQQTDRMG